MKVGPRRHKDVSVTNRTWQVKDVKVAVAGQNWALPLVRQTRNLPVCFSGTLDQWDCPLEEELNEDVSREEGKNTTIAAMSETVSFLYLGLQTLLQSGKLLVAGVHAFEKNPKHFNNFKWRISVQQPYIIQVFQLAFE